MSSIRYLLRLSHLGLSFFIFARCNIQTKSRLIPNTLSIVASLYILSFVQEKMFKQNPVSKLLKDLLIEVERFLEVFCLDSIGKMFVFSQKKEQIAPKG